MAADADIGWAWRELVAIDILDIGRQRRADIEPYYLDEAGHVWIVSVAMHIADTDAIAGVGKRTLEGFERHDGFSGVRHAPVTMVGIRGAAERKPFLAMPLGRVEIVRVELKKTGRPHEALDLGIDMRVDLSG